jgi:acetylornithine deacetylase/succinyl-diaminopimelate desuccinylase-like protein
MVRFAELQNLKGIKIHPLRDEGRTPFLAVEIAASPDCKSTKSVLMYGHLDKQPFGEGWTHPPTEPVVENGKLYGRGSSDDCYSFFSAILAVKALQENNLPHPRVIITIEGSEEGGSLDDLIHYMTTYRTSIIGEPNVVICLDSEAFKDDTLVISSSLRGYLMFDLCVTTFKENIHSGYSGITPDPYHIAVNLINRVIDYKTHRVIPDFEVPIPEHRI